MKDDSSYPYWRINSLFFNPSVPGTEDDTELFDKTEWDEIIKSLGEPSAIFPTWSPKERDCDCGAKVAKTTHSNWCSTRTL